MFLLDDLKRFSNALLAPADISPPQTVTKIPTTTLDPNFPTPRPYDSPHFALQALSNSLPKIEEKPTKDKTPAFSFLQEEVKAITVHDAKPSEFGLPTRTKRSELYILSAIILPRNNSIILLTLHEHSMNQRCIDIKVKCVVISESAPNDWQSLKDLLKHPATLSLSLHIPQFGKSYPSIVPSTAAMGVHSNQVVHTLIFPFEKPFSHLLDDSVMNLELHSGMDEISSFEVPTDWRASGQFHTKDSTLNWRNLRPQRHKIGRITACISGNWDVIYYIFEYIEYHQTIGFDHLYFCVHRGRDHEVYKKYSEILDPWIQEGFVTLISSKLEHVGFGPRARGKEVMVNTCMFYARQHDDIMGIYDIDEFPVLHNTIFSTIGQFFASWFRNHPRRSYDDLCSWTFRSYNINPTNKDLKDEIWLGEKFHNRDAESNGVWKKSFIVVKNVFLGGLHLPGACNVTNWSKNVMPTRTEGAYVVADGQVAMHHFINAFSSRKYAEKFVEDEYRRRFFPLVRQRVEARKIDPNLFQLVRWWERQPYEGEH